MSIKDYIKKRMLIFLITIVIILIILGISLMNVLKNTSGDIVIKDNINYSIKTIKKDTNDYPISKEDGEYLASIHTITVTNKDDKKSNFEIILKDKNDSNLIDKIYYKINNESVKKINNKHILYYDTLEKNETKEIQVLFWLGKDLLSKEDEGKKANMFLEVYGK